MYVYIFYVCLPPNPSLYVLLQFQFGLVLFIDFFLETDIPQMYFIPLDH